MTDLALPFLAGWGLGTATVLIGLLLGVALTLIVQDRWLKWDAHEPDVRGPATKGFEE